MILKKFILAFLPLILAPWCLLASPEEDGFEPLFDGKTLEGWHRLGGRAEYHVAGGAIVGTTVLNTPNTFLATKQSYGDFILELEYRVHPLLNSGVQIRSHVRQEKRGDRTHQRVYGYQVEIDPSARAWSAGIYDEARRGWLNPLTGNEPARKAFRQNEWNHYRIACIGDSIRSWINGVPAADLVDSMDLEGFIALQVHSYNPERIQKQRKLEEAPPRRVQVRWRNIRLRDLGRHVWKPIWDGETLNGWTPHGGGEWKVVDGTIVGKNIQSQREHGHLFYDHQPVEDFTARIEYRAVSGNSGFYFRTEKLGGNVGIRGFQAEIDATRDAGGLYETRGRGWVSKPEAAEVKKYFRPGEWNEMTVSAHGRRIVVHVNGRKSAELENDPGRLEGAIALQLHGGQDMEVHFRKIELLVKE